MHLEIYLALVELSQFFFLNRIVVLYVLIYESASALSDADCDYETLPTQFRFYVLNLILNYGRNAFKNILARSSFH